MFRRRRSTLFARLRLLVLFSAIAAGLAGATHASASVQIASTGEPAYINSTTNTWFVNYTPCCDAFRVLFRFSNQNGPILQEYSSFVNTATSGQMFDSQTGLAQGNQYTVCAGGQYTLGGIEFPEANGSCSTIGKNASVIVDRTPPNISVSVDGTATYTSNPNMSYHVDYADALAPPFPANFICRTFTTPGACPVFDYNAACSVPVRVAFPAQNYVFDCNETLPPAQPDGAVFFCARSADQAVPDIPGTADQFTGSTADKANISAVGCGNVILDRTAPSVSSTANGVASALTVKVGDLVSFAAQANDATSGVGAFAWSFGDNTGNGAGAAPAHTYTQTGTFQATASTADGAGNPGSSKVTVTVIPPAAGGATGSTGNGSTTTTAPTPSQISQQAGGGGTQTTLIAGLDIIAPKRIKIAPKLKAVPLALTASGAGKMTLALLKGTRIIAKGGVSFTRPGTAGFKLKLPRKLAPGICKLKITFTPAGATVATTKTIALRFTGPARTKEIVRAVQSAMALRGAPSLTPPLR